MAFFDKHFPLPHILRDEFKGYGVNNFRSDLIAGITVAAVALPLGLAFGVASGATAAAGLVTAIIAGFVVGALSGHGYQISGPTGTMAAVLIVVASKYGIGVTRDEHWALRGVSRKAMHAAVDASLKRLGGG